MAMHCLQDGTCKFDRKEGASSMIRCSSCMVWFHNKCMEEPEQLEGFWSCYSCRKMSTRISKLETTVEKLTTMVDEVLKVLSEKHDEFNSNIQNAEKTITDLRKENVELTKKMSISYAKMVQNNTSNLEKKDLVVSNSILRSIDCAKLEKTDVRTLNNSTINDAKETMTTMKRQFKKTTLVVGRNDVDKSPVPIAADVVKNYDELICMAQSRSEDVVVCSITPHMNMSEMTSDVMEQVNSGLLSLCAEKENVSFIDVTSMFKLEDGSFNDGFICEDGVHLTKRGVNKLAKLLELRVINKSVGCVTEFQQSGTQDHDGEWITKKRRVQNYRNNNNSPGVDNRHYCYKCGENNHSKKDCHFPGSVNCNKCNKTGHKAKFCNLYSK